MRPQVSQQRQSNCLLFLLLRVFPVLLFAFFLRGCAAFLCLTVNVCHAPRTRMRPGWRATGRFSVRRKDQGAIARAFQKKTRAAHAFVRWGARSFERLTHTKHVTPLCCCCATRGETERKTRDETRRDETYQKTRSRSMHACAHSHHNTCVKYGNCKCEGNPINQKRKK